LKHSKHTALAAAPSTSSTLSVATALAIVFALPGIAVAQARDSTAPSGTSYTAPYNAPYATQYTPSWYLVPSVNGIDPDDKFGVDDRGRGFGLRGGVPISQSWDLQFGPTYSRSRENGARYQQNTLGLDALYLFSRSRFRPFVMLGAGAEYDRVTAPGLKIDRTSPYVSAGVGIQMSLSPQWGLQADIRRAHSYIRGNEFPFNRANTNTATIGLTYSFGNASPPARPMRMPEPVSVQPTPAPVVAQAPPPAPAPAPAPAAPPPAPPPAPRFERYTLSATELFDFDSATLRGAQSKLDEIATALSANAQITSVAITGYTDRLGSEKYNLALSQRRADAVRNYFVNKNIAASRLIATGKGESAPVATCRDTKRVDLIACLEPNRRVEVEQIVIERRVP
jgi:OmpA-OmpF porin, OOP family